MDNNILKIDLDEPNKKKAIDLLKSRLAYMHDIKFFDINNIEYIKLFYKSSYGCKIKLYYSFKPEMIIILQLLLGSDYQKEVNTMLNHFKFNMEYSNRLFLVKRYKGNLLKFAKEYDVTNSIIKFVNNSKRKKNYN